MKLAPAAQNIAEWIGLKAGLVPTPLAYSHFGFLISKFLLQAVDVGLFEAMGNAKVSVDHIARACQCHPRAVHSMLGVVASMGLVDTKDELYFLTRPAKKWILKDSPTSLYWLMMFDNRVCLKWMEYTPTFLASGQGLQYHDSFGPDEWFYYQKAMEAAARATAAEVTRKVPVPKNAAKMLDIGGAHGLYSAAFCKKFPALSAVLLDLPGAVEQSAGIVQGLPQKDRITLVAGDVLHYDLGAGQYDLVLMASVAHHFTAEQNTLVAQKAFEALKPGGTFAVLEVLRPEAVYLNNNMMSAVGDFFFAMSSTSGLWRGTDISHWMQQAGFEKIVKKSFLRIPGYVAISGRKM